MIGAVTHLQAKLPYPLHPLAELAYNFWWSWSPERLSIFRSINPEKWEQYHHNPVKLLENSPAQLAELATDPHYCKRVASLAAQLTQYMQATDTWASRVASQVSAQQPIAYFSIEYGFNPGLPIYAGGLGVLAADHLKSASDLGLPLVGIGLLYRQGYFRQSLNIEGWQEEYYQDEQFNELPLELCRDEQGQAIKVTVEIGDRSVKVQIWQVRVGRVNLYLLDTNLEDNVPSDRSLTGRLYDSDQDIRIAQECVLGIGGVRTLARLGVEPQIYHLNEGHAAFALLELANRFIENTGKSFDEVKDAVRDRCIFTTHTPVSSGHDTFSSEQMERYFGNYWSKLKLSQAQFMELGSGQQGNSSEPFNMTALALRLTRAANGVSRVNGQVCRQMWSSLYPDRPVEKVPIGHITNGVHPRTWVAPLMADLYAQYVDEDWATQVTNIQMWDQVDEIPEQELWWRHMCLKEHLMSYTRSLMQQARERRGDSSEAIAAVKQLLDPKILTIGIARRFSSYKRGDLIISDPERAMQIFCHPERPVQIIIAGKAHPANDESKHTIQRLIQWTQQVGTGTRLIFIEDYDIHIAEKLVQGVDLWLNTPQQGKEASGTSGQKAGFNGAINCSILDGWWYEAYQTAPDGKGMNGWTIGKDHPDGDMAAQDRKDAESLYQLLESEIIPCYYDQDEAGIPHKWIQMMKASIKTIAPYFNTERMVKEYVAQMYLPAKE